MNAIKTPVAWQKFDDWALTGQHGMRPIYLSVMRGKLAVRDEATDRRVPFTPEHPVAQEIVDALNSQAELEAAKKNASEWSEANHRQIGVIQRQRAALEYAQKRINEGCVSDAAKAIGEVLTQFSPVLPTT